MALARIRHASVFVNSKKVAEAYKNKADVKSGDERAFGDDGVIGVSDGAATCDLTFDTVVPAAGMTIDDVEAILLSKQNVDIQAGLLNGKLWECQMRFTEISYTSDAVKGTLDGTFTLIGGEPTIT